MGHALLAGEGERVPLGGAMKARGGPEGWLTAVEALMRSALKAATKRAMKEYPVQPRVQWVRQQPAQLALLVSNIFWCKQVCPCLPLCCVEHLQRLTTVQYMSLQQPMAMCQTLDIMSPLLEVQRTSAQHVYMFYFGQPSRSLGASGCRDEQISCIHRGLLTFADAAAFLDCFFACFKQMTLFLPLPPRGNICGHCKMTRLDQSGHLSPHMTQSDTHMLSLDVHKLSA